MRITALAASLSLTLVAACDATETEIDPIDDADGKADVSAGPAELELSRDLRPVDGALHVLRLVRKGKTYDATLRTAFFDFSTGKESDTTETLGTGLACSFGDQVFCSRDMRPVDGVLTELSVHDGEFADYDVTVRTAFFDRTTGKEVDETETVASNLRVVAPTVIYARDDRPVDGALVEVRIVRTSLAGHDVELRTVAFDHFAGKEVETVETLGTDLACTVKTNAVCSRDDRPVDGVLTVVRVSKTVNGDFTATLRTAFFDRINGKMVDTTDTVATGLDR